MTIEHAWRREQTSGDGTLGHLRPVPEPSSARPWTFEELHLAYGRDLMRFVTRRVRDRELARDIVQETFLRAYRAKDRFDTDRPVWPWLATIARNLIINALRDEHRRREHVHTDLDWDAVASTADERSEANPERSYAASQRRAAIATALVSLTPRQRRVLLLRVSEDLSYEDIATQEHLSIDAVKSLLKRGRQAFREAYRSLERDRGVPLLLGPHLALRARTRNQYDRARDRLAHVLGVVRPPALVFQSIGETLSTAGLAGILLIGSAIGDHPGAQRAPHPIAETGAHESDVRPHSTATRARTGDRALIRHRISTGRPGAAAARISMSGGIDAGHPERRKLHIEITYEHPWVPGQPESGTMVSVDVPCNYFGPEEVVCDTADQTLPDDWTP